jgi:manganese efflux pump family protein
VSFAAIVVLALGLAADATAVSAARGAAVERVQLRHAVLVAVWFGGFQAAMPLAGALVGDQLGELVQRWDHWIAFVLLGGIGGKMIWEARESKPPDDRFGARVMLALAIATSIDALAAGVTLPVLHAPLALAIATIGVLTALASVAGLYAGRRFGTLLGKRLDVIGGLALIGLGTKILVEHLIAGT